MKPNNKYQNHRTLTMAIMYVDDSGSSSRRDHTSHFVLSGIIVEDGKIKDLQKAMFEYKQSNFTGDFVDAEVHTYDIYKRQGRFASLNHTTKLELLDRLYETISVLDCVGVMSVVDKRELQYKQPTWNALTVSWSFLLEWYDRYLKENSIGDGRISIDKSSNKAQRDIIRIIDGLRNWGTRCQRVSKVTQSVFVDSAGVYGIQVADAFAYCALQYSKKNKQFNRYWRVIDSKLGENGLKSIPAD